MDGTETKTRTAGTVVRGLVATGILIAATASGALPAAAIQCDKGFQKVRGELISTPYCQDAYLAEVAREYGMRASAERVRNNPNYKREVCRLVGRDIRVQSNCHDEMPIGRGGRF